MFGMSIAEELWCGDEEIEYKFPYCKHQTIAINFKWEIH